MSGTSLPFETQYVKGIDSSSWLLFNGFMPSDTVDATAYLTIEGQRSRYGAKSVTAAKIVRITQGKPAVLNVDQIAVRVTVRLPSKAFDALQPEAVIIVPEELIQHPVEVQAVDA